MSHIDAAINLSRNGRFAEALTALRPSTIGEGQRNAVELMRAELLERTGQYTEAERRAEMLLRSRGLTAEQRSLCEWILGRIDADQGLFESATKHLRRSVSVALSAKLFERASWAQCKLMLIAADANGPDSVGPMFSELRQSVMRCGSPQALANLHLAVSQMEGKRSLPGSVFRHAQVALRLLAESPNVWLEAMAEGNLVVAAILRPDFQKALTHARRAAELAERSGWRTGYAAALANLGIVSYLIGDFDEAVGHCERALTLFLPGSDEFSGTLDTLARLRLAQNRIDECEDLLSRIDYLNPLPDHQTRYVYRHASLTRIRVLMVKERYDEALHRLETLISLANNARDSSMFESAKLTKAQVFIRLGRMHEALAILRNSGATLRDQSPDVQSMYNIVVAAAFATVGDIFAARAHMQRANRTLNMLDHKAGVIDIERAWRVVGVSASKPSIDVTQQQSMPPETESSQTLQCVAAMLVGGHPKLVACEIVDILSSTRCVERAAAVIRSSDGIESVFAETGRPSIVANDGTVRFVIGALDGCAVEVVATPLRDVKSVVTLNAVTTIVDAIREIERARSEREQRAAVWPTDDLLFEEAGEVISGHLRDLMLLAQRVARTTVNVLITGESGTGKEIVARAIHTYSPRAKKPFVPFNCAAVPRDLVESQLFGHRRGAFTGADRDYVGLIRSAREGTLFLDEVGELGLELQPKLLRFLESGEIAPLGEPGAVNVDVRIVAATNTNLEDAVRDGRFREDLFYRLNVVRLSLKPLRERRDEIPGLVNQFVARAAEEFGKGQLEIAEETMERLLLYRWPGNVRQLQNELRRMVALAEPDSTLEPSAISEQILCAMPIFRTATGDGREVSVRLTDKLLPTLARIECEMIKTALRDNHGRVDAVAKALGISRKGLYLKRQRLGL